MAKTYKVSTVEVSAQSRKEWLARKRGKGEVATSAAAVVVQSEASSAPSALDALFRQVNIGTDDAPKYVVEALFPLRIGDALLDWHADQKCLGVEHATETEKANFFATGGVTAGGIGSSSGGSGEGGSTTLAGLNDVSLKSAIANDMLVYNGTHWVNTPMSAIKPDLTAYATKTWVEGKGYITAAALAPYALKTAVPTKVGELENDAKYITAAALSPYALKTELPSLAGYATEEFVTTRGYITSAALDPYAKSADVANTYATKTALQGVDIRVQAIEYIFEKDNDGVINKWQEIVDFLAGVEGTTLDGILEQFATKDSLAGYLPLSGGTLNGVLTVNSNNARKIVWNNPDTSVTAHNNVLSFRSGGTEYGHITTSSSGGCALSFGGNELSLKADGLTLKSGILTAPIFKGNLQGVADIAKRLSPKQDDQYTDNLPNTISQGVDINFKRYDGAGFSSDANGYWWSVLNMNATGGDGASTGKRLQLMFSNSDYNPTVPDKLYARFGRDEEWRVPREFAFTDNIPTKLSDLTDDVVAGKYLQKSNADWYGILFNSTSEGGGVRMTLQNTGVLKSGFGSNNDSTYIVDYVSGSNIHLNTKLEFEYDGKRNEVLHGGNYTNFNGRKLQTLRVDGNYWYPDNYFLYGQWASDNGSILDWKVDNYAVRVDIAKKLATPRTLWGQSFDGSANISGDFVTNGSVRIGDAILSWDSTNKCVTIRNANTGEKASLFVDGGITGTKTN